MEIIRCNQVDSTNDEMKYLAEKGVPEGTVIVANTQRNGKGRTSHSFFSSYNTGLYMSVLLRPKEPPKEALKITTTAAVAVCESIQNIFNITPQIKWINDIFYNSRKIGGILTESSVNAATSEINFAVLGIGINLSPPKEGFPDNIKNIAGFISQDAFLKRDELCNEILNLFFSYYRKQDCLKEYKKRSIVINQYVTYENEKVFAYDIDENFNLIIRKKNGETKILNSGEVSIKIS